MNDECKPVERVIGLDAHPDSFTAAILRGPTPAAAAVEKVFNKVPMAQLPSWAQKHTTARDLIVLEASGNSFQVVRTLAAVGRQAKVLESCQLGKLKEAHANNDKISAVRIGKAYLAGTAFGAARLPYFVPTQLIRETGPRFRRGRVGQLATSLGLGDLHLEHTPAGGPLLPRRTQLHQPLVAFEVHRGQFF